MIKSYAREGTHLTQWRSYAEARKHVLPHHFDKKKKEKEKEREREREDDNRE